MAPSPKPKVVKDPAYLAYVRGLPCRFWNWESVHRDGNACRPWDTIGKGRSEVSHLDGKSRDDRVLPMCGGCHRTEKVSWHNGQRTFCRHYGVTKEALIRAAERLYADYKRSR